MQLHEQELEKAQPNTATGSDSATDRDVAKILDDFKRLTEERDEALQVLQTAKEAISSLTAQHMEAVEKVGEERDIAIEDTQRLRTEVDEARQRLETAKGVIGKAELERDTAIKDVKILTTRLDEAYQGEAAQRDVWGVESERDRAVEGMKGLTKERDEARQGLDTTKRAVEKVESERDAAIGDMKKLIRDRDEICRDLKAANGAIGQMKLEREAAVEDIKRLIRQGDDARRELEAAKGAMGQVEVERNMVVAEASELKKERDEAHQQLEAAKCVVGKMETERDVAIKNVKRSAKEWDEACQVLQREKAAMLDEVRRLTAAREAAVGELDAYRDRVLTTAEGDETRGVGNSLRKERNDAIRDRDTAIEQHRIAVESLANQKSQAEQALQNALQMTAEASRQVYNEREKEELDQLKRDKQTMEVELNTTGQSLIAAQTNWENTIEEYNAQTRELEVTIVSSRTSSEQFEAQIKEFQACNESWRETQVQSLLAEAQEALDSAVAGHQGQLDHDYQTMMQNFGVQENKVTIHVVLLLQLILGCLAEKGRFYEPRTSKDNSGYFFDV